MAKGMTDQVMETIGLEFAPESCSQTYNIYRRGRKQPPITFGGEVIMMRVVYHYSRRCGRIFYLRLYVCVYFSARCLKTDAARITKLDIKMFHDESWKRIYFGVKRSKVKVSSHKTLPAWVFALLWRVLASSSFNSCIANSVGFALDSYCFHYGFELLCFGLALVLSSVLVLVLFVGFGSLVLVLIVSCNILVTYPSFIVWRVAVNIISFFSFIAL